MLPLLYADDDLVVVHKPEGLATIPERRPTGDSLVERLAAQLGQRLWVVHRLDKDVSGVLLLARHPAAHRCLNDQFAARRVTKTYLALVHGRVTAGQGKVDLPLRAFGSGRMGVDPARGKPSATDYRVQWREAAFTLLEARPQTGRRHQLRVHLYALGHPIVGDRRYGDTTAQRGYDRLLLHAREVACRLPSQTPLCVGAPPPPSFDRLLDRLCPRGGRRSPRSAEPANRR